MNTILRFYCDSTDTTNFIWINCSIKKVWCEKIKKSVTERNKITSLCNWGSNKMNDLFSTSIFSNNLSIFKYLKMALTQSFVLSPSMNRKSKFTMFRHVVVLRSQRTCYISLLIIVPIIGPLFNQTVIKSRVTRLGKAQKIRTNNALLKVLLIKQGTKLLEWIAFVRFDPHCTSR